MPQLEANEKTDEMYKLYGMAAHHCSNIEYGIVYLLLGPKWAEIEDLNPDKVKEAYDNLKKAPLGGLLKMYKLHFEFTTEQLSLMTEVLEKRNYLTHHFFGNHAKTMCTSETMDKMIKELTDLVIYFQGVALSLDPELIKKV